MAGNMDSFDDKISMVDDFTSALEVSSAGGDAQPEEGLQSGPLMERATCAASSTSGELDGTAGMSVTLEDGEGECVVCLETFEELGCTGSLSLRVLLAWCELLLDSPKSLLCALALKSPRAFRPLVNDCKCAFPWMHMQWPFVILNQTLHVRIMFDVLSWGEDVDFPTETVFIPDPATAEMISIEKPVGWFCCGCETGCARGFPYLGLPKLRGMTVENPEVWRPAAQDVVNEVKGDSDELS